MNYIVRGKGIANNFFYILGVACNRSNCNNNYYLNKYLDLIELNNDEKIEFENAYKSGFNASGNYIKISYNKLAKLFINK